jgi:hypothetical protein
MIDNFLKFPQAKAFLSKFPRTDWKLGIEMVFLYGLKAISRDFNWEVSIEELGYLSRMPSYAESVQELVVNKKYKHNVKIPEKKTQETQTINLKSKKIQISINENFGQKSNSSRTSLKHYFVGKTPSDNLETNIDPDLQSSQIEIFDDIKEPQVCPIENLRIPF